jgi:hypothetical protein
VRLRPGWIAVAVTLLSQALPCAPGAQGATMDLQGARIQDPPAWLKASQAQSVIDRIQRELEWDLRRIEIRWRSNQKEFESSHGYGPTVLAFTRARNGTIDLGPRVTRDVFEAVLGHELVHMILFQKYKDAIPKWLEEGLANFLATRKRSVDYAWLSRQKLLPVRSLHHPFNDGIDPRYHYQAATAVMELIASRCPYGDLLQLSVGSNLDRYLPTLCNIQDLDSAFAAWIKARARH